MMIIREPIVRTRIALVLVMVAFTVLVSCATKDPKNELGYALRGYERELRWGEWDKAAQFHENAAEVITPSLREKLVRVRISGYDVLNGTMTSDKSMMVQTVRIRYYNDANYVERTLMDRQTWKYNKKVQKWFLSSELPKFR